MDAEETLGLDLHPDITHLFNKYAELRDRYYTPYAKPLQQARDKFVGAADRVMSWPMEPSGMSPLDLVLPNPDSPADMAASLPITKTAALMGKGGAALGKGLPLMMGYTAKEFFDKFNDIFRIARGTDLIGPAKKLTEEMSHKAAYAYAPHIQDAFDIKYDHLTGTWGFTAPTAKVEGKRMVAPPRLSDLAKAELQYQRPYIRFGEEPVLELKKALSPDFDPWLYDQTPHLKQLFGAAHEPGHYLDWLLQADRHKFKPDMLKKYPNLRFDKQLAQAEDLHWPLGNLGLQDLRDIRDWADKTGTVLPDYMYDVQDPRVSYWLFGQRERPSVHGAPLLAEARADAAALMAHGMEEPFKNLLPGYAEFISPHINIGSLGGMGSELLPKKGFANWWDAFDPRVQEGMLRKGREPMSYLEFEKKYLSGGYQ